MKKNMWMLTALLVMLMVSCKPQPEENLVCVDFENIELPACGYLNQQPYSDALGALTFGHSYTYYEAWASESWSGFVVSNQTDIETPGYVNQYSVMAGKAAGGNNFAVFFRDAYNAANNEIAFKNGVERRFKSLAVCNATYAYLSMKEGDSFAKKFEKDDWFKLSIDAYDANNLKIDSIEVYLADFRQGKQEILSTWKTVDLSTLGEVNKLSFALSSSDNGIWGMNTPAYVCLDNLVYVESIEE